jgi:hypothetical protein
MIELDDQYYENYRFIEGHIELTLEEEEYLNDIVYCLKIALDDSEKLQQIVF